MLHILNNGERASVHEIATELDITESSASKHLKLLYDLSFVDFEEKHPKSFIF